jgi:creatinine amidohydrolase/Fe(II)-dependent formamide hydrolase-like protein
LERHVEAWHGNGLESFAEFTEHGGGGDPTTASAEKRRAVFRAIVGRLRKSWKNERGTLL